MFRSIAIAGLAGGLLTLTAAPAEAGCFRRHHARVASSASCCQPVYYVAPSTYTVSHHAGHHYSGNSSYAANPSGYSVYNASYGGLPGYYSGYDSRLDYGVRTTNPFAYDPIQRRAGVGYGSYYGNRSYYGDPYYRDRYYSNRYYSNRYYGYPYYRDHYYPYYGDRYYGNRSRYGYRPYFDDGRGSYRRPYYRRGWYVTPPSGRGGYGTMRGYGRGFGY